MSLIWSAPIDDNRVILDIDSYQIRNKDHEIISTVDANEENVTTISNLSTGKSYQFYIVAEIDGEISEPSVMSE